jgi:hypothetical protein
VLSLSPGLIKYPRWCVPVVSGARVAGAACRDVWIFGSVGQSDRVLTQPSDRRAVAGVYLLVSPVEVAVEHAAKFRHGLRSIGMVPDRHSLGARGCKVCRNVVNEEAP